MRYVVSSTLLYGRLQNVERVILSKNAITILSCFLFDIKENQLEVTASDGETVMKTVLELVESSQDCKFAIDAKKLMDILKEIPEQPLTLDFNPNTLQLDLNYQNGHFTVQAEPGDEYPLPRPAEGESQEVKVDVSTFSKGLAKTIIATANNEARKVMNGVHFDITPEDVSLVASDGHKLVRYLIKVNTAGVTIRFTMPQKPASILKNILDKEAGEMTLRAYGNSNAVVETALYTISCRLIEDPYPNYKGVIPQNNANVAVLDRSSLMSAMRRVMVVSDKTTTLIKFLFEPNKVTLTTEDINYAQSAEEQLVCQYEGKPLKMGFKGSDLLELIGNLQSQEMTLKLSDPSKAGLILPSEQDEGTDLLMLLMPLLINN